MTTTADMIEEVRTHVGGEAREEMNRLAAAITTTSVATLTIEFAAGSIARGAVLAIDLELMYVWSISGTTVTVQRGYRGSTAATHLISTLIYVNPRVPAFRALQVLNEELAALSAPGTGLFRVRTVDLTYNPARSGYDLTSVTDVQDVLALEATGYVAGDLDEITRYRLVRNAVTTDFASGFALELFEPGYPGKTIRVTYATSYTALAALADDVAAVSFLHAQAHDIPPLGAAARLLAGRESRRTGLDMQPEPRQAADVPPGAARQAAGALLQLRDRRVKEEAARLARMYPHRVRRGVA